MNKGSYVPRPQHAAQAQNCTSDGSPGDKGSVQQCLLLLLLNVLCYSTGHHTELHGLSTQLPHDMQTCVMSQAHQVVCFSFAVPKIWIFAFLSTRNLPHCTLCCEKALYKSQKATTDNSGHLKLWPTTMEKAFGLICCHYHSECQADRTQSQQDRTIPPPTSPPQRISPRTKPSSVFTFRPSQLQVFNCQLQAAQLRWTLPVLRP